MTFYFAISKDMIAKRGMPERFQESGTYKWALEASTCFKGFVGKSAGEVLDFVRKNNDTSECLVCAASLDPNAYIDIISSALHGNYFSTNVVIHSMLSISES